MERSAYVYVPASRWNGAIYIGVTSELVKRIWEHRSHLVDGFTRRYRVTRLVYLESCGDMLSAIEREKRLKRWRRAWKVRLIESWNPDWRDLYPDLLK